MKDSSCTGYGKFTNFICLKGGLRKNLLFQAILKLFFSRRNMPCRDGHERTNGWTEIRIYCVEFYPGINDWFFLTLCSYKVHLEIGIDDICCYGKFTSLVLFSIITWNSTTSRPKVNNHGRAKCCLFEIHFEFQSLSCRTRVQSINSKLSFVLIVLVYQIWIPTFVA